MITKHVALMGLLAAALLTASLCAQEHLGPPARPGGIWNGRYIGFVPKHEQAKLGDPSCCRDCASGGCVGEAGIEVFDEAEVLGPIDPGGHAIIGPTPLFWGRIDYIAWWTRGMNVPPLATTSPIDTDAGDAGVLGAPGTSILAGSGRLNDEIRSGGRLTLGRVMDPVTGAGIDFTYLGLTEQAHAFGANGGDVPILARPFFNTITGQNDSRLIAFPEIVEGNLEIISSTEFHTFEALFRRRLAQRICTTTEVFAGYRYARLDDLVQINEMTISLAGPTIGSTFILTDLFETQNEFHGGELGVRMLRQGRNCWSFEGTALIALGNRNGRAAVIGETVATDSAGDSFTTDSGLLVQDTNSGLFEEDRFSGLAELGFAVRKQFASGWTARFGYNFLYWSDVLRAGEQIDLDINVTQIPPGELDGDPAPLFPFRTTDFWAHGFNLGLEYKF